MVAAPRVLPDLNQLDPTSLKALILSQHEQLLSRDAEIEHLKLLIDKLRCMQFGRKSEKLERQIEVGVAAGRTGIGASSASRETSHSLLNRRSLLPGCDPCTDRTGSSI